MDWDPHLPDRPATLGHGVPALGLPVWHFCGKVPYFMNIFSIRTHISMAAEARRVSESHACAGRARRPSSSGTDSICFQMTPFIQLASISQ